jgi:hypothetical protein
MEEVVERALNVVKSKAEWMVYVKNFNEPSGFSFCNTPILEEIKDAIDAENPIHSGASLALCLQKCKIILNN